jgi:hypothetical protein
VRRFLQVSMVLALTVASVAGVARADAVEGCIGSGTEADINAALVGAGAHAVLCPGAVFDLRNEVRLNAANQRIYTQGWPTDGTRALLRVLGSTQATAVRATNQSGAQVENIQVDGGWQQFGPLPSPHNSALIEMGGNATDQVVRRVVAKHTRGWTTITVFHGDMVNFVPACQRAWILDNELGPAGRGWNIDRTMADGISLACGNTTVQGNILRDITDGAIVIFGAPGSHIRNNTIIAETRELLSAIHMVVWKDFGGNYRGTVVDGNVIDAKSAYIRIGISVGSRVWGWCDTPHEYNVGGAVINNILRGQHMGFGIAVAGVSEFTITGNVDQSRHVGVAGPGCGGTPAQPTRGFIYYPPLTSNSNLQSNFVAGNVSDRMFQTTEPAILQVPVQPPSGCVLRAGQGLYLDQSMFSCDGRFQLRMQGDGNLVLYHHSTPIWSSNTYGGWAAQAWMQGDGNFTVLSGSGLFSLFQSNTSNRPGARLVVQNDGNVVVYDAFNRALWATNTCCR